MPERSSLTPLQRHIARWKKGCGSGLCRTATHVVLGKGQIPCDVLFVGEAPGASEDSLGQPFVGPAGILLDQIVRDAIGDAYVCSHKDCTDRPFFRGRVGLDTVVCPWCRRQPPRPVRTAFTNLVGCIPLGPDGRKVEAPDDRDIETCSHRLLDFVTVARPRLLVAVGQLAEDWLKPGYQWSIPVPPIPRIHLTHPAAIIRQNIAQQGLSRQRCVVILRNALEDLSGDY